MSITEADRVANDPVPIRLLDGRTVALHYGFGGLRRIEKRFGSVKALLERLQDPFGNEFYEAVFCALWFGLWQTGISEDELVDLIDPANQEEYGPALDTALMQAFPRQVQEMAAQEAATRASETTASSGPTPITPQLSDSVVPMQSFG